MIRISKILSVVVGLVLSTGQIATASTDIVEVISPSGIKAWLVQENSIPMLSIDIDFRGGSVMDPAGKEGAVFLMTGLLEEGTGDMDSAAFARAREGLAAKFGFDSGHDSISISAQVLSENRTEALDLLKQAITYPAFNEIAFQRVKGQVQSILLDLETDAGEIAHGEMRSLAYAGHPYEQPKEGTKDSVAGLTAQDIKDIHKLTMTKDRMTIGVVGDITPAELGPLLDRLLADLPETGAPLPQKTEFKATAGVSVIDFEQPQSTIIWGHSGLDQSDPDFFAAYIMNHVLGGGSFSSRLTEEVREKRGLTYGIGSYLAPRDYAAMIGGSVKTGNDTAAQVIDLVRQEWARMAAEGPTEQELLAAQKYLTGAYALRFDGNAKIAGILVGMQTQNLGIDYIKTRNDRVNAVTLDDVRAVSKRWLKPEEMRFVVVGRPVDVASTN